MTAQAVIPWTAQEIRPAAVGANAHDVQLARVARRQARDQASERFKLEMLGLVKDLARQPIPLAVAGVTITNLLSQVKSGENAYVLTGAQAVALQVAILTPTFLNTLADATKPALDIAQLIKLIGAI